ncbi:MAG: hypothetical protein KF884_09090 [Fimbriimonadaceae bacterium]|nr:hypothetical protein [Fimbriimonadaceae bacterium]QYK57704.1 MAG: hypothetical protein KF884_09090 [Fimbriimonadaceae bacterium]
MTALALLALASTELHSSGMPRVEALTPKGQVRSVWHRVRVRLSPTQTHYEGSTLFRNMSDQKVDFRVMVPLITHGGTPPDVPVSAKWDGNVVAPGVGQTGPVSGETEVTWRPFTLSLPPRGWRVFESSLALPLQRGGEGKVERQVLYSVPPQSHALDQFQISIVYPKDLVFQMVGTDPKRGWEIGPTGAWWRAKEWKATATVFSFRFYAGTFEPIGD